MPSTLLDAVQISRHLGARTVLDAVDVRVTADSRIALAGPNGSGKSTLLRILAGELAPDGGRVLAHGTVGLLPQLAGTQTARPARDVVLDRLGITAATRDLDAAEAALAATDAAATGPDMPAADPARPGTAAADVVDRHAEALDRWLTLGGADAEARIDAAADAAGLPLATLARPLRTLSGGEASRVGLIAVEAARWDVLLLDEPTQHLDAAGLDRLAHLLSERAGYVLVSHDRALLERSATSVVALDPATGSATHHGGSWASFEAAAAADRARAQRAYDEAVATRTALADAEAESRRRAARTQAKLRHAPRDNDKFQREWFKMRAEGVQARASVLGARATRARLPDKPRAAPELRLDLTAAERGRRWVLALEGAVLRQGSFTLGPVDLALEHGDRARLAGPNGSGKSTLLAALAGRLNPIAGVRCLAAGVVVGELGQNRTALERRGPAPGVAAAIVAATGVSEPEARSALAQMGLDAAVVERPAHTLSPGERTRAELALLTLRRTGVLLLDEPTTHLDVEALELLEQALAAWPGTLVVATHDQRLADGLRLSSYVDVSALEVRQG